jgi:hypothetical protein
MTHARQAGMHSLENLMAIWLEEDPQNWPVRRLSLIDPWQERPGVWSEEVPAGMRVLGAIADEAAASVGRRLAS